MEYQIVSLLVVAVLDSMFGYIALRGTKEITNILFSFFTLALSLWALNIAFFLKADDLSSALIFGNLYYLSAAAIPVLFFYFSIFFLGYKKPLKKYVIHLIPFFILVVVLGIDSNFLIKEVNIEKIGKSVVLNDINYFFYSLYFITYVTLAYYHLVRSYFLTRDVLARVQLKFVVLGTIFAFLLGMVFNLFLPAVGNYEYIWIGPLFTLIMVVSMGYAIAKHNLFNIKAIATEILTFFLWTLIIIRIILAETVSEKIFSSLLLLLTVVIGILLIRSIYKEITTKEKVSGLVHDIATANERLRQLEKQKSEFVSIASHQLRTPLTAIKGYTSMLLEGSFGKISKEAKEAVQKIFNSSQRLVALVEDLLTVSRIEQGRIKYEFSNFNVREIVDGVIKDKKLAVDEKGLKLFFKAEDGDVPYMVRGDITKLKQVVNNITDNAIKYTSKGLIRVLLSKDEATNKIRISVSDTGMGMDEETIEHIFKMFNKQGGSSKETLPVSGIGLYVARQIMKAHRGRIWAGSGGVGQGSTFFIEMNGATGTEEVNKDNLQQFKAI